MKLSYRTNSTIILVMIMLCALPGFSQEDCFDGIDNDGDGFIDLNDPEGCDCSEEVIIEFVENGDFESFDVCPNNFSQLAAASNFYVAQGGSTDYYNTCGYIGNGLYPDVTPLLGPDNGEGMVGFFADQESGLSYREYMSTCLDGTLMPGETYTLSFEVATTGTFSTGDFGINFLNCSEFPFVLYGSTDCPSVAGNNDYFGCLEEFIDGVFTLVSDQVIVQSDQFTTYEFDFSVTEPINNIVFGGSCQEPICSGEGLNSYFYLDNLSITLPEEPETTTPEVEVAGSSCVGYNFFALDPDYESYQWFVDGVAVTDATETEFFLESQEMVTVTLGVFEEVDGLLNCVFSDPLTLSPEPEIELTALYPVELCEGEMAEIEIAASPSGEYSFEWDNGESGAIIQGGAGSYFVMVTNSVTGCSASTEFEIQECFESDLEVVLEDLSVCVGEEAVIEAEVSGGEGPLNFVWQPNLGDGPGPYEITVTENISYTLTVIDSIGASVSETVMVNVLDPDDFAFDLGPNRLICPDEQIVLQPNPIIEGAEYLWNDGQTEPVIEIGAPGNYELTLITGCGLLTEEVEVLESASCNCKVYVPNAFTPDNDGLNEYFDVTIDCPLETFELRIFNRWGQEVFYTTDSNEKWLGEFNDGQYHHSSEVYNYLLKISPQTDGLSTEVERFYGTVTVIR